MKRKILLLLIACVGLAISTAFRAHDLTDEFDDAERAVSKFLDRFEELKRLDKDEQTRLVAALCDAEEADRQSVAREAAERVRYVINDKMSELDRLKDDALNALKKVSGDERFKDKQSKIDEYMRKVEQTWDTIGRMTEAVRGSNNPVVAFMLEGGQQAHYAFQHNSSNCTVSEWSLPHGRADCINASNCEVIELKPNNSRAIYAGRDQADKYVEDLRQADEFEKLVKENSSFEQCKDKFRRSVYCYKLCPEINDDGTYRSISVDWSKCD